MSFDTNRNRGPRQPAGTSRQAFLVSLVLIAIPVVIKAWPL